MFRRLKAANPRPTTELLTRLPFELLAAVMLSAHTTDKSVNTATRKLFPVANTPQKILAMGEDGVMPYLKTVGLYRAKAKNLVGLSRMLVEKHGGKIPARSRSARRAARRGPQDREHHPQHGVRREDDRRRHAHLPRGEPHGARAGQQSARGGRCTDRKRAARLPEGCAPLAAAARTIRLHGAPARLPEMHHQRISASTATRRR